MHVLKKRYMSKEQEIYNTEETNACIKEKQKYMAYTEQHVGAWCLFSVNAIVLRREGGGGGGYEEEKNEKTKAETIEF